MAERTTDLRNSSHRRLVTRTLIAALRSVFDNTYNRDRQLVDLKVTASYPLQKVDYPCVVVEYQPQRVVNAGVGHEEWFTDENQVLRKWHHSRFEGTVEFNVFALTPLDRDLLADAVEEVIRFGRLDAQLLSFFDTLYGAAGDPVTLSFTQIMLNADEVDSGGNSASLAPWSPEDLLVYETTLSVVTHGGLYNVQPDETWQIITRATADAYPQFEEEVNLPFPNLAIPWTNPFIYDDDGEATGTAEISGSESFT